MTSSCLNLCFLFQPISHPAGIRQARLFSFAGILTLVGKIAQQSTQASRYFGPPLPQSETDRRAGLSIFSIPFFRSTFFFKSVLYFSTSPTFFLEKRRSLLMWLIIIMELATMPKQGLRNRMLLLLQVCNTERLKGPRLMLTHRKNPVHALQLACYKGTAANREPRRAMRPDTRSRRSCEPRVSGTW